MRGIIDVAAKILSEKWYSAEVRRGIEYIVGGEEPALRSLPRISPSQYIIFPLQLTESLPAPDRLDEPARRVIAVLARLSLYHDLSAWIGPRMRDEPADSDLQSILVAAFEKADMETADLVAATIDRLPLERPNGSLTSAGRWLLEQSDRDLLGGVLRTNISAGDGLDGLVDILLRRQPERVDAVAPGIAGHPSGRIQSRACARILAATGSRHAKAILQSWQKMGSHSKGLSNACALMEKIDIGLKLAEARPAEFEEPVRECVMHALTDLSLDLERLPMEHIAAAVVRSGKPEYLDALLVSLRDPDRMQPVVEGVVAQGGPEALPILRAALELPDAACRAKAAARLIEFGLETDRVVTAVRRELESGSPHLAFVSLAVLWRTEEFADLLWKLLASNSTAVRETATRGLIRLGATSAPRALPLLSAKKSVEREAAVRILVAANTAECRQALEERVDLETDDGVRDQILLALDAGGQSVPREVLQKRIERSLKKIASLPADWIRLDRLPGLKWRDGSPLDETALRYLLYRQSRAREMRADVEARAVYSQLDRTTSGEFGFALARAFLASSQESDDRWALALSALLGDDRLVPLLTKQIATWAENSRGKMAEYAVQAVALLGTDAALSAVHVLSIRYATQFRNIGKAAAEAFAAAAEAQGVPIDELGDRVVPRLGLPRSVSVAGKPFELRVDLDGKLIALDVEKKKLAALPKPAPAELLSELKELKASLKEAWKGQLKRIECLMVRQTRWPVARWRELYPRHPLLFPFAVRLMWGWYDEQLVLQQTFRTTEDQTFTTAADDQFRLPETGWVGIVHPLELGSEALQAWKTHFGDYELTPPFQQLERAVVRVAEPQRAEKEFLEAAGVELNAMTFRGRAEKLGWQRGSVCDAGGVRYYRRAFPAAGAEAFVELEDMFVGIDMYSSITLGKAFFVKAGTVKIGGYVYNEPENMNDPRVLAFGDVPAVAFSEAIGDLRRIAGLAVGEAPAD